METTPAPLPTAVELPEAGHLYQHWKGGLYRIVCTSLFEESKPHDEWMITYRSLKFQRNWTRRLKVFQTLVLWPDGKMRPRFVPYLALPKGMRAPQT